MKKRVEGEWRRIVRAIMRLPIGVGAAPTVVVAVGRSPT